MQAVQVSSVDQSRDELLLQLAEQRRFLASSCAAFDAGEHAEAKRIADTLRVLLHHLGASHALLVELGTRDQVGWLDTAGSLLPLEGSAQTPLVYIKVDEPPPVKRAGQRPGQHPGQPGHKPVQRVATWLPTLDAWDRRLQPRPQLPADIEEALARQRAEGALRSRGRWLPFAEWWDAEVLRDKAGQSFTRADLVRALATVDDEALADPNLAEHYQRLANHSSYGWVIRLETRPEVPTLSPALASVRQVAFEVERSLHREEPPTST